MGQGLAVMPCARWPTACTLNGPLHRGGYQTGATLTVVDGLELQSPSDSFLQGGLRGGRPSELTSSRGGRSPGSAPGAPFEGPGRSTGRVRALLDRRPACACTEAQNTTKKMSARLCVFFAPCTFPRARFLVFSAFSCVLVWFSKNCPKRCARVDFLPSGPYYRSFGFQSSF